MAVALTLIGFYAAFAASRLQLVRARRRVPCRHGITY